MEEKSYNVNLSLLEEKVALLVDMIKKLQKENSELKVSYEGLQQQHDQIVQANEVLLFELQDAKDQLKALELSLVAETKDLEELSQEKLMAKMTVDDLIKSIDSLVEIR